MSTLQEIALRPRYNETTCQRPFFSLLPGGFPKGCLVEITGPEMLSAAARFLEENPWMHAAWIEKRIDKLSTEVLHRDLNFSRVLFVDGKEDASWAASALIRSAHFPIVIYHAPYGEEKQLRRFRRYARESNCTVLLLGNEENHSWPIAFHLYASNNELKYSRRR